MIYRYVLLIAVVASSAEGRAAMMVDNFRDGAVTLQRKLNDPSISDTQSGLSIQSTVGGSRTIAFRVRDYARGATGGAQIQVDATAGVLESTTDDGITPVNFTVSYGNLAEPLNVDLTGNGADRLRFTFSSADFSSTSGNGFFDVRIITVNDDFGSWSGSAFITIPSSPSGFYVDALFADIQGGQPYALDFSRVIAIQFGSGNGLLPGSFVLDHVVAVPEPTVFSFLAFGSVILLRRRLLASVCFNASSLFI